MKYILGVFFLLGAALYARDLSRWVRECESDIVMSAGGDGIFGRRTKRSDQPFQFWLHIAVNGLIIAAVVIMGIWLVLGSADF